MEKDEKACSLILTLFAMLLFLLSTASCASLLIGQAASESAQVVVGVAAISTASTKEHDKNLKASVTAFNEAFRSEDYMQASVFVNPDKKEEFWSETDRFKGKIRMAEYELRDVQLDEKKNHATVILYFQYWRVESQIVKTVSFTQKWQYSEKDKTWRVSDSGFEAFPSNSY